MSSIPFGHTSGCCAFPSTRHSIVSNAISLFAKCPRAKSSSCHCTTDFIFINWIADRIDGCFAGKVQKFDARTSARTRVCRGLAPIIKHSSGARSRQAPERKYIRIRADNHNDNNRRRRRRRRCRRRQRPPLGIPETHYYVASALFTRACARTRVRARTSAYTPASPNMNGGISALSPSPLLRVRARATQSEQNGKREY